MNIRNIRVLLVVGALLVGLAPRAFADSQMLKVGLQYGAVKDNSMPVASTSGLLFGESKANQFVPYLSFPSTSTVYVIKNGTSGSDTVITLPGQNAPVSYGKWHCQIGGEYATLSMAQPELDRLRALEPSVFLAYDGVWKIYAGTFLSEADLSVKMADLQKQLIPVNLQKAPLNGNAFMVLENGTVKVLFDSSKGDLGFKANAEGGVLSFNKYKYRGSILFKRYTDSDPTVINYLPLDQYVYGVIPYEISPVWPAEALKAQAVAARNYAMISLGKHKKYGFDLCTTEDCQVYAGFNVEKPTSNAAVDLTSNKFLKYNGKLAQTYFHSNSGGRTENVENVWNAPVPYLIAVDDPFSVGSPNTDWSVTYTATDIQGFLAAKKVNIGTILNVYVEKASLNGRALKTTFVGSAGTVSYDKDKVRSMFKSGDIKSTWFTITSGQGLMVTTATGIESVPSTATTLTVESAAGKTALPIGTPLKQQTAQGLSPVTTSNGVFVINGHGNGHGIGMSQWGIKKMAEQGYLFEDILKYYFPGTYLE